jgi:hypothetical protein
MGTGSAQLGSTQLTHHPFGPKCHITFLHRVVNQALVSSVNQYVGDVCACNHITARQAKDVLQPLVFV